MTRRRIIFITGFLLVLLLGYLAFRSYRDMYQTVTVTARKPFTLTLYAPSGDHESTAYDKSKVFFVTSESDKFRVKKGVYTYAVSGNSDYQEVSQQINIDKKPVHLAMPQLDYTQAKLASLLSEQKAEIESVITDAYPSQMQLFSIQGGKLYGQGEWYGAKLVPNDPRAYDTLRIVLKKENGRWSIVTQPPEIILSRPIYPQIPASILSDLDNF